MGIMDILKGAGNFMTTPFDANRMNLGQMNPLQSLAGIAALAALAKKHPGTSAVLLGGTLGLNKRARQQREMDKINRILGLPSGTTNPLEQVEAQKFADQQLSQDMFSKMYGASQKGYTPSPWGIGKLKGNDLVNFINMNTPTAKISGNFLETQPGKFGKDRTPAIELLPETSLQRSQILRNLAGADKLNRTPGVQPAKPPTLMAVVQEARQRIAGKYPNGFDNGAVYDKALANEVIAIKKEVGLPIFKTKNDELKWVGETLNEAGDQKTSKEDVYKALDNDGVNIKDPDIIRLIEGFFTESKKIEPVGKTLGQRIGSAFQNDSLLQKLFGKYKNDQI